MVIKSLLKVSFFLQRNVHYVLFIGFIDSDPVRNGVLLIYTLNLVLDFATVNPKLFRVSLKLAEIDVVVLKEI
jgi:hypothetical protein